jgi:hypothetical protein
VLPVAYPPGAPPPPMLLWRDADGSETRGAGPDNDSNSNNSNNNQPLASVCQALRGAHAAAVNRHGRLVWSGTVKSATRGMRGEGFFAASTGRPVKGWTIPGRM